VARDHSLLRAVVRWALGLISVARFESPLACVESMDCRLVLEDILMRGESELSSVQSISFCILPFAFDCFCLHVAGTDILIVV
jgi:hypothetical protein